jgi:uncharacterized membrane protein YcaP (DUF421 family)
MAAFLLCLRHDYYQILFVGKPGIMEWIETIFGSDDHLSVGQMCSRGVVVFFLSLILIRIAGRRSFGVRTALDNIVAITLGALLSRAILGVSPFFPVVATSLVIVLLRRLCGRFTAGSKVFSKLAEGEKVVLYKDDQFCRDQMRRAMLSEEDVRQGIRESALCDSLENIKFVFMERNGRISVVLKQP